MGNLPEWLRKAARQGSKPEDSALEPKRQYLKKEGMVSSGLPQDEASPLDGCLLIGQGSLGGRSLSAPAGHDGSPSRSPAPLTL